MTVDKNYFPGFVRKSISFTIDDGNVVLDKKFIDIVNKGGIKGTFNLCLPDLKNHTSEFYRELYRGFGISNHCKLHPFAFTPDKPTDISEDAFDEQTADTAKLYRVDGQEGMYYYRAANGWRKVADDATYCRLVSECHAALEEVFGKGSITTYVWPFCEQNNAAVQDYVMNKCGYVAVRKTGATTDTTGFAVPADRMHWSYNANHQNLTECAAAFDSFEDDGELKFFCFGVHSHDFERANCWNILEDFTEKYGNRESDFWYASVEDIFAYADAVKQLKITDNTVENPTSIPLYSKIDGKETVIAPKTVLNFGT